MITVALEYKLVLFRCKIGFVHVQCGFEHSNVTTLNCQRIKHFLWTEYFIVGPSKRSAERERERSINKLYMNNMAMLDVRNMYSE
jgi:hypothetical protein